MLAPVLRSALERAHTLSSWEVQRNARAFGVAPERFVFIPFPLTATGDELPTLEDRGRRVLASGRTLCDWPLVFAAAEGQAWDLEIVCAGAERPIVERLNTSGLARVRSDIPRETHGELMREIAVYLLPLREAEVSSGHIRLMTAIAAETPVVASNVSGLAEYLEGVAMTVPSGVSFGAFTPSF